MSATVHNVCDFIGENKIRIFKPLWINVSCSRMCLAQGHNTVTSVRLELVAPRSQVKHSTTEPLRSLHCSLRQNLPSEKDIQYILEIITDDSSPS